MNRDEVVSSWRALDRWMRAVFACGIAGTLFLALLMIVGLIVVMTKWLSL